MNNKAKFKLQFQEYKDNIAFGFGYSKGEEEKFIYVIFAYWSIMIGRML